MKKGYVCLGLFDGMSGLRMAMNDAGLPIKHYFASEVCKPSINVTQARFPDTEQLGDVRDINPRDLWMVEIIGGGSPCQNFSMSGKKMGMVTTTNVEVTTFEQYMKLRSEGFEFVGQSYLFWEFIRIYNGIKDVRQEMGLSEPKFLLENVKMDKKWAKVITDALGVEPIVIDSGLLTAQARYRIYWTNIQGVKVPEDKGITLGDVIPGAICGVGFRGKKKDWKDKTEKVRYPMTIRPDLKSNTVVTSLGSRNLETGKSYGTGFYHTTKGEVKKLTVEEIEILQGLEKGYTNVAGVSQTARIKMIGNGWTIPVISHFLKNLKKDRELTK
jgi:DNA (cytosine-5)-methyltransferase 3A